MAEPQAIPRQVRLPLSVAMQVVLQGIRIRLGRSMVTILGVVFGIAFLMSILTGLVIKRGVSGENRIRAEIKRMRSFLLAETGPLAGREVVVLAAGPLSPLEERFLGLLREENPGALRWQGAAVPPSLAGAVAPAVADQAAGAHVLLVVGEAGQGAAAALPEGLGAGTVVAASRKGARLEPPGARQPVCLERDLSEDELRKQAEDGRKDRFRSVWIVVISLVVTVIGIANAMLMSVTERFREIGTMKCLGALSAFIRQIFLIESILMGLAGGIVGSVIGLAFSILAYGFTYGFGLVLFSLTYGLLGLYFLACIAAGVALSVVAALYPAGVASRMVPANALRSNV